MKTYPLRFIFGTFLLLLSFTSIINAKTFENYHSIHLYKEYQGAKYEPVDGCLLGAYVLEDPLVDKNITTFNEVMGKNHATSFMYVGYGMPFPTEWVNEVKALGGTPHIAWEPNNGLHHVVDDAYLREFAQAAADADVPIQLRFASEANGTWTNYDSNADLFKEKWILVHDVMEEVAPKVSMLWSVFTFPEHTIEAFYPGDDYVDWVGVNIYNVVYHNDSLDDPAVHEDPLKLLDYVYNLFSHKKPIHISEFGATHYTRTDETEYPDFAIERITRLYEHLESHYPRVKAISYFNTNALNTKNVARRINDYSLTTNTNVQVAYQQVIQSDHFLSDIYSISPSHTWLESFTYTGNITSIEDTLYVAVDFFTNLLELEVVSSDSDIITLSNGTLTHTFTTKEASVPAGFYDKTRHFISLPLREVCESFGYSVFFNPDTLSITLH